MGQGSGSDCWNVTLEPVDVVNDHFADHSVDNIVDVSTANDASQRGLEQKIKVLYCGCEKLIKSFTVPR